MTKSIFAIITAIVFAVAVACVFYPPRAHADEYDQSLEISREYDQQVQQDNMRQDMERQQQQLEEQQRRAEQQQPDIQYIPTDESGYVN